MTIKITFTADTSSALRQQIEAYVSYETPVEETPNAVTRAALKAAERGELTRVENADDMLVKLNDKPKTVTKVEPEPQVETLTEPDAPTDEPIPYSRVRDAVLAMSVKRGRDVVLEMLKKFGAEKKADEIAPDRFAEVLDWVAAKMEDA